MSNNLSLILLFGAEEEVCLCAYTYVCTQYDRANWIPRTNFNYTRIHVHERGFTITIFAGVTTVWYIGVKCEKKRIFTPTLVRRVGIMYTLARNYILRKSTNDRPSHYVILLWYTLTVQNGGQLVMYIISNVYAHHSSTTVLRNDRDDYCRTNSPSSERDLGDPSQRHLHALIPPRRII
jgi:hypothetical protein